MKGVFLLLLGLFLSLPGTSRGSDTLVYESGQHLTWADFKGRPNPGDRAKGAQITVTINLKVKKVSFWTGRVTYEAFAIAFKDKSWVKPAYKDDYTLAHEQLHFDIAQIYAKTLELEINNLEKPARQKALVEDLLSKSTREMVAYQALYDRQTHGGNNVAKQKEWARKVAADLEVLD